MFKHIFLRGFTIMGFVSASFILQGCGQEEVSCSSAATINALEKITAKTYSPVYEKFNASLSEVRTQKSDGRSAVCAATMHVNPIVKSDYATSQPSMTPSQFAALKKLMEAEKIEDITYKVERTDDGKSVYVTLISSSG